MQDKLHPQMLPKVANCVLFGFILIGIIDGQRLISEVTDGKPSQLVQMAVDSSTNDGCQRHIKRCHSIYNDKYKRLICIKRLKHCKYARLKRLYDSKQGCPERLRRCHNALDKEAKLLCLEKIKHCNKVTEIRKRQIQRRRIRESARAKRMKRREERRFLRRKRRDSREKRPRKSTLSLLDTDEKDKNTESNNDLVDFSELQAPSKTRRLIELQSENKRNADELDLSSARLIRSSQDEPKEKQLRHYTIQQKKPQSISNTAPVLVEEINIPIAENKTSTDQTISKKVCHNCHGRNRNPHYHYHFHIDEAQRKDNNNNIILDTKSNQNRKFEVSIPPPKVKEEKISITKINTKKTPPPLSEDYCDKNLSSLNNGELMKIRGCRRHPRLIFNEQKVYARVHK